jgi:hypothetical protein
MLFKSLVSNKFVNGAQERSDGQAGKRILDSMRWVRNLRGGAMGNEPSLEEDGAPCFDIGVEVDMFTSRAEASLRGG